MMKTTYLKLGGHYKERQAVREMVTGESHYYRGRRYRLNVIERPGRAVLRLTNNHIMELQVPPGTDKAGRQRVLERHHSDRFRELMDQFMPDWRVRRDELNQAPLSYEHWDY